MQLPSRVVNPSPAGETTIDYEHLLRRARRPLVLGIGGGGDVVGALATAHSARLYDGAHPVVGGVSWERRVIDSVPGPRRACEIEGAVKLAPGILLAGCTRSGCAVRRVTYGPLSLCTHRARRRLPGPAAIAASLATAVSALQADLVVFVDVGGDVLAQGGEPGLSSPLCDALMLAAAARLAHTGVPVLGGVFGIGCDAELTPDEVLSLIGALAADGGLAGVRGLTDPVATCLEAAVACVPTEASAQAVRAFRGARGPQPIRGERRTVQFTSAAALTYYFDVTVALAGVGRLARAVADARTLEEANAALGRLEDASRRPHPPRSAPNPSTRRARARNGASLIRQPSRICQGVSCKGRQTPFPWHASRNSRRLSS